MNTIEFSVLHYYPSFISEECINIAILFHNLNTGEVTFEVSKNWNRIKSFDDELNVDFMKDYLIGIRNQVVKDLSNFNESFSMKDYCRFFVNEYKFSNIQTSNVAKANNFIENTKKIFLRFDYEKTERLNKNQEKHYIKELLKSNDIDHSSKPTEGPYNDDIKYDYMIDNYGIKLFTFQNKSLSHQIMSAKNWAFNAHSLQGKVKTIFIYDVERDDDDTFYIIMDILKSHSYKVLNFQEGFEFILSLNKNTSLTG